MNKFVIPEKYLLGRILSYKLKHVIPIIDYAVEHNADKHAFEQKYNQILHDFPNSYHAIKLSGIDLSSVIAKRIAHRSAYTNNKLLIDAEEVGIQKRIGTITDDLIESNHKHIFKTYQMCKFYFQYFLTALLSGAKTVKIIWKKYTPIWFIL